MQPTTCPPTADPDADSGQAPEPIAAPGPAAPAFTAARLTAGATATAARARRRVNPATLNRITESAAVAAVEAFYRSARDTGPGRR